MKVLFIVQGEGRGHFTQAISMAQILNNCGHSLVGVLVGKSKRRTIPDFFKNSIGAPVLSFESPNFLPSPKGRNNNIAKSVAYSVVKSPVYVKSMFYVHSMIHKFEADLVINFYELLTGLTYATLRPSVPMICVAHQYMFLHHDYKFPDNKKYSSLLLRFFTRLTALGAYKKWAISINPMSSEPDDNLIVIPPLLRKELYALNPGKGDYWNGYLLNGEFNAEVQQWHSNNKDQRLEIYWDKGNVIFDKTLRYHQLDDNGFLKSMAKCNAFVTTAGFESVCEALYLGKPVFMVPTHIEQECNAYDADRLGIGLASDSFDLSGFHEFIGGYVPNEKYRLWIRDGHTVIENELKYLVAELSFTDVPKIYKLLAYLS